MLTSPERHRKKYPDPDTEEEERKAEVGPEKEGGAPDVKPLFYAMYMFSKVTQGGARGEATGNVRVVRNLEGATRGKCKLMCPKWQWALFYKFPVVKLSIWVQSF